MKIKEVCKQTGLTERTIRYYVEEGLIAPQTTSKNGREYRTYSEQDVAHLMTIASMRKLFFTMDEIKEMKDSPNSIRQVIVYYKQKLASDAAAKSKIVAAIERLDESAFQNIAMLANQLREHAEKLPLPRRDIEPNFGRFEESSKMQREHEYQQFLERQEKQFAIGKVIVFSIAGANVILSIISFAFNFNIIALIIQIILAVALFAGVTWVRYLFAIGAALAIGLRVMLIAEGFMSELTAGWIVFFVCEMLFYAMSCVLLLASDAVK